MKKTYIKNLKTKTLYPIELCQFFGKSLEIAEVYYDSQDEWNDTKLLKAGEWQYVEEEVKLTSTLLFSEYQFAIQKYDEAYEKIKEEIQEIVIQTLGKEPEFDYSNTKVPVSSKSIAELEHWWSIRKSFYTNNPDFKGIKNFGIDPENYLKFIEISNEYQKKYNALYDELISSEKKKLQEQYKELF